MKKHEVMEYMQRYLDKDLSEAETAALHEYLKQDPESMLMFERMNNLSNDLANLPKVSPPFSIVDSIMPQLDQLAVESSPQAPKPKQHWFTKLSKSVSFKAGVSVALAAGVVGLFIWAGELPKSVPVADEQARILEADRGASDNSAEIGDFETRMSSLFEANDAADLPGLELPSGMERTNDEPHFVSDTADASGSISGGILGGGVDGGMDGSEDGYGFFATDFESEASPERVSSPSVYDEELKESVNAPQSDTPASDDRISAQQELGVSFDGDISTDSADEAAEEAGDGAQSNSVIDESEAFAVIPSPNGHCTAKLFEKDGQYKIVIYDRHGEIGYSSTWNAADAIEDYRWSHDGTSFEFDLVEGEQRTSIRVHVEKEEKE